MCDGDLKCCLQEQSWHGPEGTVTLGSGRVRGGFSTAQEKGVAFPLVCAQGAVSRGHHRRSPAPFYLCWTPVHDSPWGAPEEDLAATAVESRRTLLFCGLLGQGTPLSCKNHAIPCPMGTPLLLHPPGWSLPWQGHTFSSPLLGTCLAIAQLGPALSSRLGWTPPCQPLIPYLQCSS